MLPLLQQLQVAADGRQRGTQVVGNVGHRSLQLPVSLPETVPQPPQLHQLPIQLPGQSAHLPVPGGEVNEGIGLPGVIPGHTLLKGAPDFPGSLSQQINLHQQ